jgi:hypothetical protein
VIASHVGFPFNPLVFAVIANHRGAARAPATVPQRTDLALCAPDACLTEFAVLVGAANQLGFFTAVVAANAYLLLQVSQRDFGHIVPVYSVTLRGKFYAAEKFHQAGFAFIYFVHKSLDQTIYIPGQSLDLPGSQVA